jgi:H+/gluconate symporter-like permease
MLLLMCGFLQPLSIMELSPFLILFVGIAIVIGLIIGARLNAFLALITAAMVVSLLSPGEIADKIARAAKAFGDTAGGIGIVIALAAVIGKCLMVSGAADRIVQSFLKALGEKRSSLALAGGGFVLSIPVFFDTVFYLLVPLARSLYRNTRKHYLKYVLAICAGAAVTHTLIPPTPGPLLMAQQLGVNLGVMIGIGALIGIPATVAGLAFGAWADKRMPVKMRPLPGDEVMDQDGSAETGENRKLPGLVVSLLPILLPVILIGINTILETRANAERAAQVSLERDLSDIPALRDAVEGAEEGPLKQLRDLYFTPQAGDPAIWENPEAVVASLNRALIDRNSFPTGRNLARANLAEVEHLNRLVLENLLPESTLARHDWLTPARRDFNLSKLYGNPNFALLISAGISAFLFLRMRRPSRTEFSEAIESALMSGGLIILITSAGGAFGAMLKEAQVGPAIAGLFADGSRSATAGAGLLALAFAISALMKIAQGSTTVAVITASGMMAAMIEGTALGFNPVYLATAIGGGGLIGSWMNDSGFWIFSKMGGITEVESLKSWTPLLCVLGVVTFVMSLLLSMVLPLL